MSNSGSLTKEKIVHKAIEMYNQYGIEYVGVRELAKELKMKGGNITYYFPTKDDIIMDIATRMSSVNRGLFSNVTKLTLYDILNVYRNVFHNQYQYRGIFLSLPHLVYQNEEFKKQYLDRQVERRQTIYNQIKELIDNNYLMKLDDYEINTLVRTIALTNRFWISEASVDQLLNDEEKTISFALQRLSGLFSLVATAKGKKEINKFLRSLK